jgi:hypothetical protein
VSGVRHNPDAVALVRCANVGSSHNIPFRVIPETGKVSNDSPDSSMNEHWAVFHKYESGSNFANHPRHVIPHGGIFSIKPCASSGNGNVGAWKAARYDINNACPWLSVKGLYVIPNRERREKAVILSGAQYACWVWLPFDCADCSPSKELASEYSSTSACEKSQLIHHHL